MRRAEVLKLIDEQLETLEDRSLTRYHRGRIASLYILTDRIKRSPLGPDEWRVPPGAPNPHGLPVEPVPFGVFRAWIDGMECYVGRYHSHPEYDESKVYRIGDPYDLSAVDAWRPEAVGPGGGA